MSDDQKIPERKRSSASHGFPPYSTACSALHLGFWKDRNEDERKLTPWRWLGKSGLLEGL